MHKIVIRTSTHTHAFADLPLNPHKLNWRCTKISGDACERHLSDPIWGSSPSAWSLHLVCRQIYESLIFVCQTVQGLFEFSWGGKPPPLPALCTKVHRWRCNIHNHQHVFAFSRTDIKIRQIRFVGENLQGRTRRKMPASCFSGWQRERFAQPVTPLMCCYP